ncbi:PHB depolymerase family esterase [uncultured Rhodoblastus sp.]|uniref:extracellular catalytic domain type 1 short-chain-length polyhydroxyalkanoate depolymerase n=1 Tax=uncultured Rhodoblastus sp. TaxID=543037 RepID=UPI0025CC1040|nr:PHB depolymerase family esterase [uncultured Rhodoblastus sp.]
MARAPKRKSARSALAPALWAAKAWMPVFRAMAAPNFFAPGDAGRVVEVANFGANPGALRMFVYAPAKKKLAPGAPLIVVLHGCGQDAAMFARNSGWIALAERLGAALLLPEQTARNSAGRCFNWYQPGDVRRGAGEAKSIRQMVRAAAARFRSDPRRVYIVGLSAGGAMAAALLAAYPTVFAGGGVVAGMPVGAAFGGASALLRMHRADRFTTRALLADAALRAAPPTVRPRVWPKISIWQGGRDRTVDPRNAEALAAQWTALQGFDDSAGVETEPRPGIRRRVWSTKRGAVVEFWALADMGHGFPVDSSTSEGGRSGFCVLDVGWSAARHMAQFWGIDS